MDSYTTARNALDGLSTRVMLHAQAQPSVPAFAVALLAGASASGALYALSSGASNAIFTTSYSKLSREDRANWDSRLPSTIHAVAMVWVAVQLLFFSDLFRGSADDLMFRASPMSTSWLGLSTGYFITDLILIAMYFPHLGGWAFIVHHLAALTPVVVGALIGEVQVYIYLVLVTEATTPFVNLRFWLDKSGGKKWGVYKWNGVAMVLTWFLCRVVLFGFVFWHMWRHWAQLSGTSKFSRGMVFVITPTLCALNLYWFTRIIVGLVKLFKPPKKV